MWNPFKKSKEHQTEDNKSVIKQLCHGEILRTI